MIGTYESITIFTRLANKVRDSLRYFVGGQIFDQQNNLALYSDIINWIVFNRFASIFVFHG